MWHQDQLRSSGRVEVPLSAYAGERSVRLRFHFTGPGMLWGHEGAGTTPLAGRPATAPPGGPESARGRGVRGYTHLQVSHFSWS